MMSKQREQAFGRNVLPKQSERSFVSYLIETYNDKTLIMLTVAAFVSLSIGTWRDYSSSHPPDEPRLGWVEGTAILLAVLVVVLTNAINNYQKEAQFKLLNSKREDRVVNVIRNGQERELSVFDLLVGDILILEPGDIIPADGIYLEGHNVTCDESSATGESDTVKKTPLFGTDRADCYLLSGAKILEGVGRCIIVAVGENSFYGRMMMAMRGQNLEGTPLQIKLDSLAEQIAKIGFAAALLMFFALVFKYVVIHSLRKQWPSGDEIASTLVNIVIQTITIIVVAVPEGLPMAVTMALAFATTQMLKDNNLVRVLSACETMGNATAICTDKTGTLTENVMTVEQGMIPFRCVFDYQEASSKNRWATQLKNAQNTQLLIAQGIAVNSTAYEGENDRGEAAFIGSKTECALLNWIKLLGYDFRQLRRDSTVVEVYPFASKWKSMSTIVQLKSGKYQQYTKGASEIILSSCTYYMDENGNKKKMNDEITKQWQSTISSYANQALRTIGIAYREIPTLPKPEQDGQLPLDNMTLLGVVAITDPLRPGVVEAVRAFRKAGVFVRMITGDNIDTAKAIARTSGILTKGGIAMSGPEFRSMTIEEQRKILPRLQVLARSGPLDKTIVVARLQEQDQVVGMTGDGTNDGPALKMADVGFSMGITGTEVAKEASDIVLMDDNFNSILKALLWGRAVNDGVRKFLTFQLTVNIAAVVLSFISSLTSSTTESVLTAVQLLWVNLIMDTLAALALATEPPSEQLLLRKPVSRNAHLINFSMMKMIVGQAIFQVIVNLVLLYQGNELFFLDGSKDGKVLRTMIFNVFVFMQIFNEINCRRIDNTTLNVFQNITHHSMFIIIQVTVIISQFLIVTFGGLAFKTVPLTASQWLVTKNAPDSIIEYV
ncbi:PMCA-type calcium-translocating P-type ATPase [Hesseltinella vesiculosa]|uniref:Calcium-transporting ATPase n=1 Tax=Hesseltinella vesiculosa TaxID=101127 RepID=A0A1X2GA91_9FUNG|nr:PMCA-type calcium-translocating P-type ATPase [Hesseltinella vesiculosa]